MEELYHIFSVFDYKGGELSSDVNLTKKQFLEHIAEKFESFDRHIFKSGDFEDELTEKDWTDYENLNITEEFYDRFFTAKNMSKYISDNSALYAGGGDDVSEWYVSKNNKLEHYQLSNEDYKVLTNYYKRI